MIILVIFIKHPFHKAFLYTHIAKPTFGNQNGHLSIVNYNIKK